MITIFTEHGKLQGSCPEAMGHGGGRETFVLVCETSLQMKILRTEIALLLLMYDFKKKYNETILFCSDVLSRFPSFINYIIFYEFNF